MDIPTRHEIGDCLQRLRIKAGFKTADKFAEYIGINKSTYTGYEQGKGMFSYERAWQLADALNCSLDELGGREWPPEGAVQKMSPEEQALVGNFRRMEPDDQATLSNTARTFALAGDAKKEEAAPLDPKADPMHQNPEVA